jgi:hypothetical protein
MICLSIGLVRTLVVARSMRKRDRVVESGWKEWRFQRAHTG